MRLRSKLAALSALLHVAFVHEALADDWKVTQSSGASMVFFDGRWAPLRLGDIVADAAAVRTLADGVLRFERDHETIDVQPNTEIRIVDRKGQRFTTVQQYFGTVGVEANRENVQHFAVKTPYLAAVVKGTVFGVTTNGKISAVAVSRGKVGVSSAQGKAHSDVTAGQTATVSAKGLAMGHGGATGASSGPGAAAAASASAAAASSASAGAASSSSSSSAAASSSSAGAASGSAAGSGASGASAAAAASAASAGAAAAPSAPAAAATSSNAAAAPAAAASTSAASTGSGAGQGGPGHSGFGHSGFGHGGFGVGGFGHGGFGVGHQGPGNGGHGSNGGHGGGH